MRPLTFAVPKTLLAVCEKPILQLIIEQLRDAGFDEITVATGYLAELIQAFCGDGSRFGVRVDYLHESQPLGTAGPASLLRGRVARDEFFLLMNGDIVTKLDFAAFLHQARQRDCDLMVGYVHHKYQSPFGVLTIDEREEITGITEKPEMDYCISGGIYALKGTALDFVPNQQFFTIPDLIERLRASGRRVGAYHIREFWRGVENPGHIVEAREALNGQLAKANGARPKAFAQAVGAD
jgi:NDP-sugar pyrophosphorylase family protein